MTEQNQSQVQEQTEDTSLETKIAIWSKDESRLMGYVERSKGLTIAGNVEGEKAGYKVVKEARQFLKSERVSIEKSRKSYKAPILALSELVDSTAKKLTAIIEGEEERLEAEEKAYELKIAEAKRIEEEAKKKVVNERIAKIQSLNLPIDLDFIQNATDAQFMEFYSAKAEEKRIADAQAEELRKQEEAKRDQIRSRVSEIADLGLPVNMASVEEFNDSLWAEYVSGLKEQKKQKEAEEIAKKEREEEEKRVAFEKQKAIDEENQRIADAQATESKRLRDESAALEAEKKRIADAAEALKASQIVKEPEVQVKPETPAQATQSNLVVKESLTANEPYEDGFYWVEDHDENIIIAERKCDSWYLCGISEFQLDSDFTRIIRKITFEE